MQLELPPATYFDWVRGVSALRVEGLRRKPEAPYPTWSLSRGGGGGVGGEQWSYEVDLGNLAPLPAVKHLGITAVPDFHDFSSI